jgi:hypothetical protein
MAARRTMIRQRIKAGLKRAVAQGVKLGRPKIDSTTERKVRKQLAKGVGILKVAKSLGIGTGTVQRIANERAMSPQGKTLGRTSCDTSGSPVTCLICDTKRWAPVRLIRLRPAWGNRPPVTPTWGALGRGTSRPFLSTPPVTEICDTGRDTRSGTNAGATPPSITKMRSMSRNSRRAHIRFIRLKNFPDRL